MIKVLPNQTVIDIAIQEYGSIEYMFEMIKQNQLQEGLLTNLQALGELNTAHNISSRELTYIKQNRIQPATGIAELQAQWILRFGVWNDTGVWIDESNWID